MNDLEVLQNKAAKNSARRAVADAKDKTDPEVKAAMRTCKKYSDKIDEANNLEMSAFVENRPMTNKERLRVKELNAQGAELLPHVKEAISLPERKAAAQKRDALERLNLLNEYRLNCLKQIVLACDINALSLKLLWLRIFKPLISKADKSQRAQLGTDMKKAFGQIDAENYKTKIEAINKNKKHSEAD